MILFYLLFTRYLLSSNKGIIWRIVHSFLVKLKFKKDSIERLKKMTNNGDKYKNLFILIFFIIISILLLFFYFT